MARLTVADDEVGLASRAAEHIAQLIADAAAARGSAIVSLTGGTTPRLLYSTLADSRQPWRDRIPWTQVQLFWSDERHVPPDDADSNYRMAKVTLLDHVPIPADRVHRMRGELPDAHDAAADYERVLTAVESGFSRIPLFDLMLLGVGSDAHIASIFPGSELLESRVERPPTVRRVAAIWAPHLSAWRITLTPDAILDSRTIVVLVAGTGKADAVRTALHEPLDLKKYPAQLLRSAGHRVEWFVDRAAAARL
ncbi:MAG: 6-phosphogluconolactonase [Vicinamibacterales bacterium]